MLVFCWKLPMVGWQTRGSEKKQAALGFGKWIATFTVHLFNRRLIDLFLYLALQVNIVNLLESFGKREIASWMRSDCNHSYLKERVQHLAFCPGVWSYKAPSPQPMAGHDSSDEVTEVPLSCSMRMPATWFELYGVLYGVLYIVHCMIFHNSTHYMVSQRSKIPCTKHRM